MKSYKFPSGVSDKYQHCVLSCQIFLICGPFAGLIAGAAREFYQIFFAGDFAWQDQWANNNGILCGMRVRKMKGKEKEECQTRTKTVTCESCCKEKY